MATSKATLSSMSLALAIALFVAGCRSEAEAPERRYETSVRVTEVVEEDGAMPIRSSGRLSPKTSMQLAFKTGGVIDRVYVDEGDRVRSGQLLAQLDLVEIDAQVALATSSFEKAVRDEERMQALFADSIVSLEQLQNVETARIAAESNLKMARFNRRHSEILAPADGRIQKRHAESSELVSGGQPILEIGASNNWVVRLGLPDRDVVKVALGDEARIRFDAYPGAEFEGRVTEIAEAAEQNSGTFEVEVSVVGAPKTLKNGFIASVEIVPSELATHKVIPIEALVEGNGRTALIYTVNPETGLARRVTVEIAAIYDDRVAVASGLEDVDIVVTEGAPYLTDGSSVRIED